MFFPAPKERGVVLCLGLPPLVRSVGLDIIAPDFLHGAVNKDLLTLGRASMTGQRAYCVLLQFRGSVSVSGSLTGVWMTHRHCIAEELAQHRSG